MRLLARLRAVFTKPALDADFEAELAQHLEAATADNIRRGMTPDEARRQACIALGGLDQTRELHRDTRGLPWLEDTWRDLRFSLRQFARSPGFTAIAVLTLALGIGANTAIFSVVNAVLLRPLPYALPDRLVQVWSRFTGIGLSNDLNAISVPEFNELAAQAHCFSQVAALRPGASFNLNVDGLPQRVEGAYVTPSLFPLLGVPAVLGRTFAAAEAEPGRNSVVVLSHGLWQRAFGNDPGVLGRQLNLNGVSHEVVGVMPAGFASYDADLWTPLAFSPDDLKQRGNHGLLVVARVRPELTLAQAQMDLDVLSRSVIAQNPGYDYKRVNFGFISEPLLGSLVGDVRKPLWILVGAVALVLLIACANVANLLLIRASAREREVAVRMALGAGRGRLCRQWLAESVVLALLGGAAGLFVAQGGLKLIQHLGLSFVPRIADATLDGRVLAFTMLVSLGTGMLFSLAPALHTLRQSGIEALRGSDRSVTAGRVAQRLRHALIVGELALALVLLSGASLLLRSFTRVLAVESGFRTENVLTMRVSLPSSRYGEPARSRAFYREVLDRIAALPGVEVAGATTLLPLSGGGSSGTAIIDSPAVPPDQAAPEVDQSAVTPGYFAAMGIPVLGGRVFDARDTETSEPVVVIDETLAQAYWPRGDAVGQRLRLPGTNSPWLKVIGVVRHVRSRTLEAPSRIQVYWPQSQRTYRSLTLVIRTKVDPRSLAATVRKEIAAVDPEQPAYNIRTMTEWAAGSVALRRLGTLLLAAFSGVAVMLAVIGVYGAMACWVERRTHEIGLRMAVGARETQVLGLILRKGMLLAAIGVAFGLVGSLATNRLMASLLYEVTPADPLTLVVGPVVIGAVALAACWLPARRAARIDPMVALRAE